MHKIIAVLLTLLILLSAFTYLKLDELKSANESLKMLKLQHEIEYETRNMVDIQAREIYDAIVHRNSEYLKSQVSNSVKVENDKITFENGYVYTLTDRSQAFVLRQRYFFLNEDHSKFLTGYEIILDNVEFVPVYNFEFTNENGEWKLNNLYEE